MTQSNAIIDITMRMIPGMAVWPGDSPFEMAMTWTLDTQCPVNVSKISLSPHTGTHMDSAFHYDNDGLTAADMPLDPYIGPAFVVDAVHCGPLVKPEHIRDQLPDQLDRVLIKTTDSYDPMVWPTGFTALHRDTVVMLAEKGCKLIGIDTPSMDPEDSKDLPAHLAIRDHGLCILESLMLKDVVVGVYELIALPLKLEGCDGSPVRAVLRPLQKDV